MGSEVQYLAETGQAAAYDSVRHQNAVDGYRERDSADSYHHQLFNLAQEFVFIRPAEGQFLFGHCV